MKSILTVFVSTLLICSVHSLSAEESSADTDELKALRQRVKQLEAAVSKLENNKTSNEPTKATSLADAVEKFNVRAASNPIGRTQPALTVAEVLAAIRWLKPGDAPVTAKELAAFKKIAETQMLPPGTEFEVISRFIPSDKYKFQAWSVRLRMPRTSQKGWTYAFPIRERWISSTPLSESDRKYLKKWQSTFDEINGALPLNSLLLP